MVEDLVDCVVPKVEDVEATDLQFTGRQYYDLMQELIGMAGHSLRTSTPRSYVVNVDGKTVTASEHALSILSGAEAEPEMYQATKFRYRCDHLEDGRIRISAFEHMLGYETERRAFLKLLEGYTQGLRQWLESRHKG